MFKSDSVSISTATAVKFCLYRNMDALIKAIEEMEITEDQRYQMKAFVEEKLKVIGQGEMKEHHFERMAELGFGNGGVVLKVQHKPTSIIMARKVSILR